MREPKNQMLGTMEPPLMQLSFNVDSAQTPTSPSSDF